MDRHSISTRLILVLWPAQMENIALFGRSDGLITMLE